MKFDKILMMCSMFSQQWLNCSKSWNLYSKITCVATWRWAMKMQDLTGLPWQNSIRLATSALWIIIILCKNFQQWFDRIILMMICREETVMGMVSSSILSLPRDAFTGKPKKSVWHFGFKKYLYIGAFTGNPKTSLTFCI